MTLLELRQIQTRAGDFLLDDISLSVGQGDLFLLLGPSGSGKSLLLETIAGLRVPRSGSILLNGSEITAEKIQNRKIGLVFQDHAVFPHLSVYGNIAYSLHGKGMTAAQRRNAVEGIADALGVLPLLHRKPMTLSGGELQRVALARTLIQQPEILLLDEPLSDVDSQLRSGLRSLLRTLNRQGQTILMVSHDYEEALALGTKIAVMQQGRIIQQGPPDEVFHHPASPFVAHFTGARNFFRVRIEREGEALYGVAGPNMRIRVAEADAEEGFLLIRSEDIFLSLSAVQTSATNLFPGIVREIVPSRFGAEILVEATLSFFVQITRESLHSLGLREGAPVYLSFKASAVRFIL